MKLVQRLWAPLLASALVVPVLAGAIPAQEGEDRGRDKGKGKGESAPSVVQVGLEKLEADGGRPVRGRRVALVAHGASVTVDGRSALQVLRDAEVEVVRLFAPEHGLRSNLPSGQSFSDVSDKDSGLPVISLYGPKTKPAPEELQDVDALVFDLQDTGARLSSTMGTMILCLEAAAEAGVDFVVLDRPNPLGDRVAGPYAERAEGAQSTLTNLAPGPLVHGLTVAEMARYVNEHRSKKAKLKVVPMTGWRRGMQWSDTGRAWVPPAPHLRSAEAAFLYPGVGLLEATNVSDGRGTDTPYLLIGAPWLRSAEAGALVSVPGFSLEPALFMPRSSSIEPNPRYRDQDCRGLRVRVRDVAEARPYELGVALLWALRRQPEFEWRSGALETLMGTRVLREALRKGDSVEVILQRDAAGLARWRRDREKSLLGY